MRIEKVTIVNAQKDNETIVFGPIDGGKSVVIVGDHSKHIWVKAISFALGYTNEMVSFSANVRECQQFNGSVEIAFLLVDSLFNNDDANPTQKRLVIRRSIDASETNYSVDGVHSERVDVKNLLQSYGFAQCYPFQFSIQRNDLTSIEMSNELDRLKWLKDCCGVDEYCKKKEKSMRVLNETEEHIRKIDDSLKKINVQLEIFESDDAQQTYQRYVTREKELTDFQRKFRIEKIRAEIERVNLEMKTHSEQVEADKSKIIECTSNGTETRRENKKIAEQIHAKRIVEQQLQGDIDEYDRTKLELVGCMNQLQDVIDKGAMAKDLTMNEKQLYEAKMDETRTRIGEVDTQINTINVTKAKLEGELNEYNRQVLAIFVSCQQNQRLGTQFSTTAQRNGYLNGLIRKTKAAITRENRKKNKITNDLQPHLLKWEGLKATAAAYTDQLTEMNAKEESDSFNRQQEIMTDLENQKFELIEQCQQLTEKSNELMLNLEQVYDELRSQIGDSIFEGTKSMKTLMKKGLANTLQSKYFGLVIDHVTCQDPLMNKSLAPLMGECLFYHIVDTAPTAAYIIGEFNKANMPGEINFFILDFIDETDYDENDSISSRFCTDAKYQKVFEKIFHEIPSNVRDALNQSSDGLESLSSLSPDVIEKEGALIVTNSGLSAVADPIELYEKHENLVELDEATRFEQSENAYRMDATICSLDASNRTLGEQYNTIASIQNIQAHLADANQQIAKYDSHIQAVQADVELYENKVKELTDTLVQYESELNSDLLSPDEKIAAEQVSRLISDKANELQQVNGEIGKLQAKRDQVVEFFNQILMSRYSAIQKSVIEYTNATEELIAKEQEQMQLAEQKCNTESELDAIRLQIVDLQKQQHTKQLALRGLDQLKTELYQRQQKLFVQLHDLEIAKKNFSREIEQLLAIRAHDVTELSNPDILGMNASEVNGQLDVTRHQLKTYQNTNSFDLNILEKFKRDRESFVRRRSELARIGGKISAAMELLDSNINSSIESTFNDLAKHFGMVFQRFVANGSARLHLIKVGKTEEDADFGPNNFTFGGVEIFAQFGNENEQPFDDLLGQQRRVVSFAFIVAMQLVCPAPFYVFDCIDELFFDTYLAALIGYLNNLSNKAQIIITSNRQGQLNGLNFIGNLCQSSVTAEIPKIHRVIGNEDNAE